MTIDLIVYGIFIIYSFSFGVKVGQSVANNKQFEVKTPLEKIGEFKDDIENRKNEKEQAAVDEINLYNIENYDGTSLGQKDFK